MAEKKPCNDARISCQVSSRDRAGRAPYNFVPLQKGRWKSVSLPLPTHAAFHPELHSGVIEFELKAKTDFYIRGMWKLEDFLNFPEEKPVQKAPFQIYETLRLPGTSLRGLLRGMVEMMSGSPMDYINDTQLFFRAVASVAEPGNRGSFEPQTVSYKGRLLHADQQLKVQAGYLYASRDKWYIQPATTDHEGRQFYRHRTPETWLRRKVKFDPDHDMARVHASGREEGWLVCSGPIFRKQRQWVIRKENPDPKLRVEIPHPERFLAADPDPSRPDDVKAYKEGGISREIRKNGFEFTDQSQGVPCFYVRWPESAPRRVSFGHTPYFRMPYVNRPPDCIPVENSRRGREDELDMARAIFGWVPRQRGKPALRGRVTVEDGVLVGAPPQPVRTVTHRTVLGQPKPTTYQHYLVQPSDQLAKMVHWDGTYNSDKCIPIIRGHKLYWHRPGAEIRPPDEGKGDNVATEFRPGAKDCVFRCRVRYSNLRLEELGALLTAIRLPGGCAHHLGMAKPLGLGSFEVIDCKLKPISREARYHAFLDESGALNSGITAAEDLESCAAEEFATWYCGRKSSLDDLWQTECFRELRALLTFPEGNITDWNNMTRYLEFGRAGGATYNEYLQVPPRQPGGRPDRQPRRPLPPATQVALHKPSIPNDPRPKFESHTQSRGSAASSFKKRLGQQE